jgi:hypothetical protein
MYKRASKAMAHAHQVNAPLPTGGHIGATVTVEDDFIASAGNMDLAQCKAELGRLSVELAQANNQLEAAKRSGNASEIRRIGNVIQTLGQRRNPYKQRIHILSQDIAREAIRTACKEILPEDLLNRVWGRAAEIETQAGIRTPSQPTGGR